MRAAEEEARPLIQTDVCSLVCPQSGSVGPGGGPAAPRRQGASIAGLKSPETPTGHEFIFPSSPQLWRGVI